MIHRFLALTLPALLSFVVVPDSMAEAPQYTCPEASLGETAADCPWAGIARELSDAPLGSSLGSILRNRTPSLYRQVRGEKALKDWHSLWGYSINFDELAHGIIVDPTILTTLYSLSGIPAPNLGPGTPDHIQHAGLEHTYGYLFSVLKTAFGYKRARWVNGEINRGFGFSHSPISPAPQKGSLFENVTYFIGRIAFRHDPKMLVLLEGQQHRVDGELGRMRFDQLKITRLEETLALEEGRTVVLRTDLVSFPVAPPAPEGGAPAPNDTLLVYSYVDQGSSKLVSAFPVTASFGAGIMQPQTLGENQTIITRYNAYIPGVTGRPGLKGTRTVVESAVSK